MTHDLHLRPLPQRNRPAGRRDPEAARRLSFKAAALYAAEGRNLKVVEWMNEAAR